MDRSRQERGNLLGRIINENSQARNVPDQTNEENENNHDGNVIIDQNV